MIPFRFQRITRRQGGGDEAYFTYVEEADDAANKVSQRKRIGINIFKNFQRAIRNTLADVYKPGILWALPALREHSRN